MVGRRKNLIGVIYRPPNAEVGYWNKVEESIERAKAKNIKQISVLGDMNCNLLVPNSKLSEILENFNMTQLITEPTHITENSQTLIDIIATTSLDLVKEAAVRGPSLSNHCDVELVLRFDGRKVQPIKRKITVYNQANWTEIKREISNENWNQVLKGEINEQVTAGQTQ